MAFCPQCGERLNEGALFCPRCGTRVPANAQAQSFAARRIPQQPQQQVQQQVEQVVNPALQALREAIVVFGGPGVAEVGRVASKGETIISAWQQVK